MSDEAALIARRERLLGTNMSLFYEHPAHIVRGEGVWLYDADGRLYLDCYNNVPHVGHCHPHLVEAVRKASGRLLNNYECANVERIEAAERLVKALPPWPTHLLGMEASWLSSVFA